MTRLACSLLAALCACHAPLAREVIATPGAPAAIGPYSQAVRAGPHLWLAGQIGIDPATGQLVPGGIEAETRRALENLEAVLAAAGLSPADVVAVQVYLADLDDFAAMNAVYAAVFDAAPPARATVEVGALPRGARVEIAAQAYRWPR